MTRHHTNTVLTMLGCWRVVEYNARPQRGLGEGGGSEEDNQRRLFVACASINSASGHCADCCVTRSRHLGLTGGDPKGRGRRSKGHWRSSQESDFFASCDAQAHACSAGSAVKGRGSAHDVTISHRWEAIRPSQRYTSPHRGNREG